MPVVKKISRKIVFPAIIALGAEKLLSRFSDNKRLILCYHGCNPHPDFNFNGRHISSNQLERHLLYFKDNFNVISLQEMFRFYRENITPEKRTIAITFDDGYLNNYTTVFPLLEKHGIQATFFILSGALVDENYIMWPDIVDIIRMYSPISSFQIGNLSFQKRDRVGFYCVESGISLFDHIKKMGKVREPFLHELMLRAEFGTALSKAKTENYKLINIEQLKKMSVSPLVEIGSHSHLHYNLGNIDFILVKEELSKSKEIIESTIGKEVKTIAFPDGSYSDSVKQLCQDAGYENLIAVIYQCKDDSVDKRILPRITISNTTIFESNMIQVNLGFKKRGF